MEPKTETRGRKQKYASETERHQAKLLQMKAWRDKRKAKLLEERKTREQSELENVKQNLTVLQTELKEKQIETQKDIKDDYEFSWADLDASVLMILEAQAKLLLAAMGKLKKKV